MPDFLSPAWMRQVEAATPALDPALTFTVAQVIVGGPHGDVSLSAAIAGGVLTVRPGSTGADLTMRLTYATGAALATGAMTVHDAILPGAVKVSGDLDRLQTATSALVAVAEAMRAVQGETSYPG
ncbi:MAG: hypothetical protein NVS1B12_13090 [Acidimicrobiales bacterium]